MKTKKYPELWSDKDADEMANIVWKGCFEGDCDACEHRLEVDNSTCHVDLISELWRKWKNALEADKESKKMRSNISHWSFKHEFHPSTFPSMMAEATCGGCGHLSYFVSDWFDQLANYCPYCGAKMSGKEAEHDNAADISADCDEEGSWEKFAEYCAKEEKSWKTRATVHVYKCHRQKQS